MIYLTSQESFTKCMNIVRSHFGKMQLWIVEHFFFAKSMILVKKKSVQLFRVAFFRSDFLQNPYFSTFHNYKSILKKIIYKTWVQILLARHLSISKDIKESFDTLNFFVHCFLYPKLKIPKQYLVTILANFNGHLFLWFRVEIRLEFLG